MATAPTFVTCPDGTRIDIAWSFDGADQCQWTRELEHWPAPMTPMERWIWDAGAAGADRAWGEAALNPPPFFQFQLLGPFLYFNVTEPSPELLATLAPQFIAAAQRFNGALRFWTSHCEPRIIQAAADLDAMPDDVDLKVAAETLFYGFHQTFTCLGLIFIPGMRLAGLLTQFNVSDPELTGHELTQGGDNATQMIDERIWDLTELARGNRVVLEILQASGDGALTALREDVQASGFIEAFDALIAEHGRRSQGWMLIERTWSERPESVLALVRAQLAAVPVSPTEWRERTTRIRKQTLEHVLTLLPPDKHDELRSILDELDGVVPIREGRAYWQLVICGAMRGLILRIGERLRREGRVDDPEDALFLSPDDIAGPTLDLRPRVAAARAEWERWRIFSPPESIGTIATPPATVSEVEHELRGSPASRGIVAGTVRIISHPDDGERLQQGDILVCQMTTPAWTPLFAVAGGIITETGGALSHPAITAREYGIPAVVALAGATTKLRDGQRVTIDGASGVVTLAP